MILASDDPLYTLTMQGTQRKEKRILEFEYQTHLHKSSATSHTDVSIKYAFREKRL